MLLLAARLAGAAVVGQVAEQFVHCRVVGRVINEAAGLPAADQPGVAQLLQMEAEAAVGFGVQMAGQISDAQTLRSGLDKTAKDAQPGFVGERLEGIGSEFDIHIYRIVEILLRWQGRNKGVAAAEISFQKSQIFK